DRRSQEIILGHLHRLFPHDALCAEEATPTLAQVSATGPRLWIVDPIDGTRGFARKNGEVSVMVAFVDQGLVVLGVVLEPARERLPSALGGAGCGRRDGDLGTEVACGVTTTASLAEATLTQSPSRPGQPSRRVMALRPARVVETYSA